MRLKSQTTLDFLPGGKPKVGMVRDQLFHHTCINEMYLILTCYVFPFFPVMFYSFRGFLKRHGWGTSGKVRLGMKVPGGSKEGELRKPGG